MAQNKNTTNLTELLLKCMGETDPMLSMLEWLCTQLMEAEVSGLTGAAKAIQILEDGLEDSLAFYAFSDMDSRKISSTNMLERLNKEIRRRTNVVGIFPNPESYLRLVVTYLMKYAEDWSVSRAYLSKQAIAQTLKMVA